MALNLWLARYCNVPSLTQVSDVNRAPCSRTITGTAARAWCGECLLSTAVACELSKVEAGFLTSGHDQINALMPGYCRSTMAQMAAHIRLDSCNSDSVS